MRRSLVLLVLGACGPGPYPVDDVLRLNHVQSVGTHNSYHVETTDGALLEWAYTHRRLDGQLDVGVRQFELDLWLDQGALEVHHVPVLDEGTTCPTLARCLQTLAGWSAEHPGHHPFVVMLEVKSQTDDPDQVLPLVESAIAAAFPADAVITPAEVRGDAVDLPAGIAARGGWPTLDGLRGRVVFAVLETDLVRTWYDRDGDEGHVLFANGRGELDDPWSAFHSVDDPEDPRLPEVVAAGHLLRTRADAGGLQARDGDFTRLQIALASGAHFLSTDWPEPHPVTGYVVAMPGGTPSRCNPISAPPTCTPDALESPARL